MKNFWVTFPPSPKCRKIRVFSDFIAPQGEKKNLFRFYKFYARPHKVRHVPPKRSKYPYFSTFWGVGGEPPKKTQKNALNTLIQVSL